MLEQDCEASVTGGPIPCGSSKDLWLLGRSPCPLHCVPECLLPNTTASYVCTALASLSTPCAALNHTTCPCSAPKKQIQNGAQSGFSIEHCFSLSDKYSRKHCRNLILSYQTDNAIDGRLLPSILVWQSVTIRSGSRILRSRVQEHCLVLQSLLHLRYSTYNTEMSRLYHWSSNHGLQVPRAGKNSFPFPFLFSSSRPLPSPFPPSPFPTCCCYHPCHPGGEGNSRATSAGLHTDWALPETAGAAAGGGLPLPMPTSRLVENTSGDHLLLFKLCQLHCTTLPVSIYPPLLITTVLG